MKALQVLKLRDDAMIGMPLAAMLKEMGHTVCAVMAKEIDARLDNGSDLAAVDKTLHAGFVPHFSVDGDIAKVVALRLGAVVLEKIFQAMILTRAIELVVARRSGNLWSVEPRAFAEGL